MSFLRHIEKCNNFTLDDKTEFVLDDKRVGYIRDDFVDFLIDSNIFVKEQEYITLNPKYKTKEQRDEALKVFAKEALKQGITNRFMDEPYPIIESPIAKPICLADRSISTLLGLTSFGQHLNGYVKSKAGLKMWIGRRSYTKGYEPGKLDHLVAGGLPYGIGLRENLQKECYEEAGIDKELADRSVNVGYISYMHEYSLGGKLDIVYCYDLELPESFVPKCTDGEVEEFYLMPIEEVANIVKSTDDFKLNCNLVIIDFLIRHGYLSAEDKDYLEIAQRLIHK